MAKTTLNAKNLETLGAERLAALVMEVCEGDAARKRTARAALLGAAGGSVLAGAVSKRLVTLRRSKSWINYRKRRAFVDDLDRQRALIATQIAADAPQEALDLIWRFMALADIVHRRIDDGSGAVADVFRQACRDLGTIIAKAKPKTETLAEQVFQALTEANGYGEFDGLIEAVAPALGEGGLAHLRDLLRDAQDGGSGTSDMRHRHIMSAAHLGLLAIADALGDIDAYVAEYSDEQLRNPVVAAGIAKRLILAGRADEALHFLDEAEPTHSVGRNEWVEVRLLALEVLGRLEEAQSLRWRAFERDFDPQMLRAYLKELPDFEDDEAEARALDLVASDGNVHAALTFLIQWPDHRRAAALIIERRGDLDGDLYYKLGPAAEALEATEPLAATLLLRPMIEYALSRAKSMRYKHAARHLQTCDYLSGVIDDWGDIERHDAFAERLRKHHVRKHQFWRLASRET